MEIRVNILFAEQKYLSKELYRPVRNESIQCVTLHQKSTTFLEEFLFSFEVKFVLVNCVAGMISNYKPAQFCVFQIQAMKCIDVR